MSREEEFRVRPGKTRSRPSPRAKPFVTQALIAAKRAGGISGRGGSGKGGGTFGRGRPAALRAGRGLGSRSRNVVVKTWIVRHGRARAPLSAHLDYLERDGVTREGERGRVFDAAADQADGRAFATRCRDDRHHHRFMVGPEDAADLADLRRFTRDLMADAEKDLGTRLDWVAVDHWNTEHPHVHVLVRGVGDDGRDLVISRDYLTQGLRARAMERATLELGPRTELEIRRGLEREVKAERWTPLDRGLVRAAEEMDGVVDLRPPMLGGSDPLRTARLARMRKLERLGLAEPEGPARWRLSPDVEPTLRELGQRDDIIKRLHRAMRDQGVERASADLVLDGGSAATPVIGRLAARGLDDELRGSAYVVIDGVDGRAHHLSLPTLDAAGDSAIGSIVEARWTEPGEGKRSRLLVSVRSDLDLAHQIEAEGATWLDRQLVGRNPARVAERGFGQEVRDALGDRTERLIERGWAERRDEGLRFKPGLLNALRDGELEVTTQRLSRETGLTHQPLEEGETVAGEVRRRLTLASGRFAMIDDGLGFALVPWRDDLGREIGRHVSGVALPGGGVDWSFGRKRGLGL